MESPHSDAHGLHLLGLWPQQQPNEKTFWRGCQLFQTLFFLDGMGWLGSLRGGFSAKIKEVQNLHLSQRWSKLWKSLCHIYFHDFFWKIIFIQLMKLFFPWNDLLNRWYFLLQSWKHHDLVRCSWSYCIIFCLGMAWKRYFGICPTL